MESGISQLIAHLSCDSTWLRQHVGVSEAAMRNFAAANRHRVIIGLRLMLLRAAFEYEAYRRTAGDINKLYWDLFEKYLMLPRHEDLKPWALDADYVARPLQSQYDLLGAVVAGQTLAYFNAMQGGMSDNPETRSYLVHNYFRHGSRYAWTDLLERGTGERPNPGYLLTLTGN